MDILVKIMDLISYIILWPGDMLCKLFGVKTKHNQELLRIYLNLFIYTKLAILWVFFYLNM